MNTAQYTIVSGRRKFSLTAKTGIRAPLYCDCTGLYAAVGLAWRQQAYLPNTYYLQLTCKPNHFAPVGRESCVGVSGTCGQLLCTSILKSVLYCLCGPLVHGPALTLFLELVYQRARRVLLATPAVELSPANRRNERFLAWRDHLFAGESCRCPRELSRRHETMFLPV